MNEADKVQFDSLIKIAEFNIQQFNRRRDHSWKVALSFWGAVISSIAVISPSSHTIPPYAFIIAAGVTVLLHFYWLYGVFKANQNDKLLAFAARDQAIRLLKDDTLPVPKLERERVFFTDWSVQFQIAVTIVLAFFVVAYLLFS